MRLTLQLGLWEGHKRGIKGFDKIVDIEGYISQDWRLNPPKELPGARDRKRFYDELDLLASEVWTGNDPGAKETIEGTISDRTEKTGPGKKALEANYAAKLR